MNRAQLETDAVKKGIIPKMSKEDARKALEQYNDTELIDLILERQGHLPQIPRAIFDMNYHADFRTPPVDMSNCRPRIQKVKIYKKDTQHIKK